MDFIHLHQHSEYSLLDGMSTPEEIAEIVSTNGQFASAITDHGTMGAFIRFQKAAKKQDIKPIFGVEAYFVDDVDNDDKDTKAERFHLILLAKNDKGLENLFKINRVAWTDQFYYKPRIDFSTIEQFNEGIICLSGCMGSALSQAILDEDIERAELVYNRFKDIYQDDYYKPRIDFSTIEQFNEGIICLSGCMGSALSQAILDDDIERAELVYNRFKDIYHDDYYIEIQPHNTPKLNETLIDFADSFGTKLVGTLDCHFPTKEDWGNEEVLLVCGQRSSMNATMDRYAKEHFKESCKEHDLIKKMDILYPDRRLSFKNLPLYIATADECLEYFKEAGIERTDILENTVEIAEKCNAEIKLNGMFLPSYVEENKIKMTSNDYLEDIATYFLKEKGFADNEIYVERLKEELEVIIDKNFSDYFLILWDIVSWAEQNEIAMGPGRGSACGSLLSYVLGITKVDPIKHDLLFFRFLNPERNDFPDIDLDFMDTRRDEVKEYVRQKYGEERVAGVAAYGTFQDKAVIKAITNAFCIPYEEANNINKAFEKLEDFDNPAAPTYKTLKEFAKEYPEILPIAKRLHGRYKTASAHAAGIVVSNIPMDLIVPIEVRKEANTERLIQVIAYDKDEVGEMGLIKFDPLSLKAITVIEDCLAKVKENYGKEVRDNSLDIDRPDQRVFDEFNAGNIVGIFQAEGAGYANLIADMGIYSFDDLVASNALVRPGSFETQGATYLAVRDGTQDVSYDHEILEGILNNSYGTYIYEEQVMKIAVELAGFSWAKADRLRKIISKKKDPVEFKAYEDDFINGASEYISTAKAKALWKNIEKASAYMFNKSHSTAYSLLSYQTMWLKVNYPYEFIWATLYNEDKPENITTYIYEAERLGISFLGPDVNDSDRSFKLEGDKIRFGINNISACGDSAVKEILTKRPYESYEHFVSKVAKSKVKANVVENLEKVGFFESLGHSPYEKERYFGPLLNYPIVFESIYDEVIEPCSTALSDKGNINIIRGVIKNTKKTPKYYRVEIEDSTGVYSGFADKNISLSKRDYVIAMVGDQAIMHVEDFNTIQDSMSPFAKFLKEQVTGDNDPYSEKMYSKGLNPGLNVDKYSLGYLMSEQRFMTKTGSEMQNIYFFIPAHGILKVSLFGGGILKFADEVKPFDWKMIKLSPTKRGDGYYLNDIQGVEKFCRMKGIIL